MDPDPKHLIPVSAVFRNDISLKADPDPGFYLNADMDPDSGFWIPDLDPRSFSLKIQINGNIFNSRVFLALFLLFDS